MKTKQFIKEIKSMGFDVVELHYNLAIYDDNEFSLAHVSKEEVGVLITDFPCFYRLDYDTKLQLLNLLIKYAKTPIEERKDEKKYYLKQIGLIDFRSFLNYVNSSKTYTVESAEESDRFKTQFTQAEIDSMPECYTHPAVWEKIKVERED